MKINRRERNRVFVIFLVFSAWSLCMVYTLVKTQVFNYDKYTEKIKAQSRRIFTLHPKRGTIYDRHGDVLAISVKAHSAFLSNKQAGESRSLLTAVSKRISLERPVYQEISRRIDHGDKFIWIKRKLDHSEYERLRRIESPEAHGSMIGFVEEYRRRYPQGFLAAHVLGGVGIDEQGLGGIEYSMDDVIRGRGGRVKVLLDARHRIFEFQYLDQPIGGKDLYLTIDSAVQFFVEKALQQTIHRYSANRGAVIVQEARSGAVLAMASYPTYRPDRMPKTPYRKLKNLATSFLYDPGSTFKIVLASSALEHEVCYPQQLFNCYQGEFHLGDRTIRDVVPHGKLTFEEVVVQSSNIGAVRIGQRLGKERYYQTIRDFGFGEKTGVRLPAEENGILHPPDHWTRSSLTSLSFGYEISVTPLQMVQAFNIIATGGYRIRPFVVDRIQSRHVRRKERARVLSPAVANRMLQILTEVVCSGTGHHARISGLDVAGKTGTAQKVVNGTYQPIYMASFGGFFPAGNPLVTIYLVIDEPRGAFYGGDVAAPLFRQIAEKILIHLHIFPDLDAGSEVRL